MNVIWNDNMDTHMTYFPIYVLTALHDVTCTQWLGPSSSEPKVWSPEVFGAWLG